MTWSSDMAIILSKHFYKMKKSAYIKNTNISKLIFDIKPMFNTRLLPNIILSTFLTQFEVLHIL